MGSCGAAFYVIAGRRPAEMHLAVYLPLLLPALLTPLARPLADRLPQRQATWLLTGAAAVLAPSATLALALLAVYAVIRLPAVASLGHISLAELGPDTAYAMPTGLLAGILVTAAAVTGSASLLPCFPGLADSYRQPTRPPRPSPPPLPPPHLPPPHPPPP